MKSVVIKRHISILDYVSASVYCSVSEMGLLNGSLMVLSLMGPRGADLSILLPGELRNTVSAHIEAL
jgi:hypothetical protein